MPSVPLKKSDSRSRTSLDPKPFPGGLNPILVVSGPSGSGKTTLISRLRHAFPETVFSVSHTTRSRRPGEQNGREYYFIGRDEFLRLRDAGMFAEWAEVHQEFYGTSRREILEKSNQGPLLLDVDVQGAAALKSEIPGAFMVFVVPPSLAELRSRLQQREGGLNSAMERRLETALVELRRYEMYDFIVVNDDLDQAAAEMSAVYRAVRQARPFRENLIKQILESNQ